MRDKGSAREQLVTELQGLRQRVAELEAEEAEHRRMETMSLERQEQFHRLSDVSTGGIAIHEEGRILEMNRAFAAMFGYEPSELVGTSVLELLAPEYRDTAFDSIMSGYEEPYEAVYLKRDGSASPLEIRGRPTTYQGRMAGVATVHDIADRKHIEEELKAALRRLIEVQEDERRGTARRLHADVGQPLAALELLLGKAMRAKAEDAGTMLGEAKALLTEAMVQVQDLSLELRPSMLDDLGLLPALLWYFDHYSSQTGVRVYFRHDGLDRALPPDTATAAYRIVQEALDSVAAHTDIIEVAVRVWADNDMLFISVEDQGIGFDPAMLPADAGRLRGIEERALRLGGKLEVESTPGAGTCLTAGIPLPRRRRGGEKKQR